MNTFARLSVCLLVALLLATVPLHAGQIVYMIGEKEYKTIETLPVFHAEAFGDKHSAVLVVPANDNKNSFPKLIESLKTADLLLVSVRRRALPAEQLKAIKAYVASGKPVVGIRTASHAFDTRGKFGAGQANWVEFDKAVLGGNYTGHYGKGPKISVRPPKGLDSPILSGVALPFDSPSHLYKNTPIAKKATLLLNGTSGKNSEPVAWTHTSPGGGKVFSTSLGGPGDFQLAAFKKLLANGMQWAMASSAGEGKGGGALAFSMKDIEGKQVDLNRYKGKVVLMVNVASQCGRTPQYKGLQSLHLKYAKAGLAVVGFPCNQFGGQEPGTALEIKKFCTDRYQVTFDLFAKIDVNGDKAAPLYKYLTSDQVPLGKKSQGEIKWNFEKFLIGRDGQVLHRFGSGVDPARFEKQLVQALKKQESPK
jgi:glutathione peroxidase